MQFGVVIVGDEILSGKRQDKHLPFVIEVLHQRGLTLSWVRIVGDEPKLLVQTFRETQASGAAVFSFGGIGGTPDDLTRQCAATAFGVPLVRHSQAYEMIVERFGNQAFPHRIRMAELPEGAKLIPNPINQVPGFSIAQHHFVPGFPDMSHPMIEWVLDQYYAHLFKVPEIEKRLLVHSLENDLVEIEEQIVAEFPDLRLSSLPNTRNRGQVDLGLKGAAPRVAAGITRLKTLLEIKGIAYQDI